TCVPLFFIIMCFYIVPLFINGPETKTFFLRFHEEVAYHWWHFLLHIQNYYEKGPRVSVRRSLHFIQTGHSRRKQSLFMPSSYTPPCEGQGSSSLFCT
ncbi:hypothetical protein V5799_000714, partial [Amblyomma americanum]